MFKTFLWKEYRQHLFFLVVMMGMSLVFQYFTILHLDSRHIDTALMGLWVSGFAIPLCYLLCASAFSYAVEGERRNDEFLRMIPVEGGTILAAKLTWIAVGLLVLLGLCLLMTVNPLLMTFGISTVYREISFTSEMLPHLLLAAMLVPETFVWGLFWSTRWPSRLFAFAMAVLSIIGVYGFCFLVALFILFCGGVPMILAPSTEPLLAGVVTLLRILILVPVAVSAVQNALRWNRRCDRRVEKSDRDRLAADQRRASRRATVTTAELAASREAAHAEELLRRKVDSPFYALLKQSIRQSRNVLILGLIAGVYTIFWTHLFWWMEGRYGTCPDWFEGLTACFVIAGITIGFVFCGSIFTEDFRNNNFRILALRGVSPRAIWWSRILPFLVVYLLPFFWIFWSVAGEQMHKEMAYDTTAAETLLYRIPFFVGVALSFYLLPFATAAFLAGFTKGPIRTAGATVLALFTGFFAWIGWLALLKWWSAVVLLEDYRVIIFLTAYLPLLLLFGARWHAEAWVRERTFREDWRRTALVLFLMLLLFMIPLWAWSPLFLGAQIPVVLLVLFLLLHRPRQRGYYYEWLTAYPHRPEVVQAPAQNSPTAQPPEP